MTDNLRERIAILLHRCDGLQPSDLIPEHYFREADALIADGIGDVSAERERAEQAEAMHKASSNSARDFWGRVEKLRSENRALQARIDAAPHDPRHCDLVHYPDKRKKGTVSCTCWKSAALVSEEPTPDQQSAREQLHSTIRGMNPSPNLEAAVRSAESASELPKLDPVLVQLHRYTERYEDRRGATAGQRAVLDAIQSILDGGQVVWAPSDDRRVR